MQMFYCIFNILFPKLRQHQNTKGKPLVSRLNETISI